MGSKPHIKLEELEFIKDNCLKMSDEAIAIELGRDIKTIRRARKKLGLVKAGKKSLSKKLASEIRQNKLKVNPNALRASQKLNEDQRIEFFRGQLTNSLYYNTLKEQFTKEELDFYLEEWGSLCLQFEDVVATEKRQIDALIKSEIMGNRIMRNIKYTEDLILKMQKEILDFRAAHDMTDEENQERDEKLGNLLQRMSAVASAMTNDYQKNQDARNRLFADLNSRRIDRIDQLKKSGITFAGIVTALRDRETREIQGKHMELVKLAKKKKQEEFRKPVLFPDGSTSCILLDDQSQLDNKGKSILSENHSVLIDEINQTEGKNILILEDDIRRLQLFQEIFKNHKIHHATYSDEAIKMLDDNEFSLICLGFDLRFQQKGSDFARSILDNNKLEGAKFLIHSMNEKGVKELVEILTGKRIIEVCSFEKITKMAMENKNG